MFKSATSIKIKSKTLTTSKTVFVAPTIKVQGIVLRSSTAIPKEVLELFTSQGARIDQFEEDGDRLVRVTGSFSLSEEEVQAFLKKHKNLAIKIEDDKELKEAAEAKNFQKQVYSRLQAIFQNSSPTIGFAYTYFQSQNPLNEGDEAGKANAVDKMIPLYHTPLYDITPNKVVAREGSIMLVPREGEIKVERLLAFSKMHCILKAKDIELGSPLDSATNTGILGELVSGGDATIQSSASNVIKNMVALSGGPMILSSEGSICLSYEPAYWTNPATIPSLVFAFDQTKKNAMVAAPSNNSAAAAATPATVKAAAPAAKSPMSIVDHNQEEGQPPRPKAAAEGQQSEPGVEGHQPGAAAEGEVQLIPTSSSAAARASSAAAASPASKKKARRKRK